jgi:hypothetical protein
MDGEGRDGEGGEGGSGEGRGGCNDCASCILNGVLLGRESNGWGGQCSNTGVAISKVKFCLVSVALSFVYHAGTDVGAFRTNRPVSITSITKQ